MSDDSKLVTSFHELSSKAGWYPLYIAPLAIFDFHEKMLDIFKAEAGITLRCSKIKFPFPLSKGLPPGTHANEVLLVDVDYIDIFRQWLTSYRLKKEDTKEYYALTPTYCPISDPILRAARKIQTTYIPVTLNIITYSGNRKAIVPVQPVNDLQPLDIITFVEHKPDPLIIKEAHAYFTTRKITS